MIDIPQRIKELLHADSCYKNIRIHFPNGERTDICNDMIVFGSVELRESICSRGEITLGLNESPTFECEVVGVENIDGCTISVSLEIECEPDVAGSEYKFDIQKYVYSIPLGAYIVTESERQSDFQHRKIVASNIACASDWAIPEYEKRKLIGIGSSRITVDLGKVISTFFDFDGFAPIENPQRAFGNSLFPFMYSTQYSPHRVAIGFNTIEYIIPLSSEENLFKAKYRIKSDPYKQMHLAIDYLNERLEYYFEDYFKYHNPEMHPYNAKFRESVEDYYTRMFSKPFDVISTKGGYSIIKSGQNVYFKSNSYVGYSLRYIIPIGLTVREYVNGTTTSTYFNFDIEGELLELVTDEEHGYNFPSIPYNVTSETLEELYKLDLRELFSANTELAGKIARTTRKNSIDFIVPSKLFAMNPNENLYPSADLKPEAPSGESISKNDYQECWYADKYTEEYGYVRCSFRTAEDESIEILYSIEEDKIITGDIDSRINVYDISGNFVIRSGQWAQQQILAICRTIGESLAKVSYLPIELKGRGLPYVEPGDTFEVLTPLNESITTVVLNRTMSGEQILTDKYSTK